MKTALIIIDMQNDYFKGGKMELIGTEEAAENCFKILELFRRKQLPIFHVQHLAIQPDPTFFIPQTEGAEIHQSLTPQPNEHHIIKHFPSSFRETELLKKLQDAKIERLVVCGAMSHMCVDTTVRAAFDLGLSSVVIADGCATRDLEFGGEVIPADQVHGAYMAALGMVFAEVISCDELLNRFNNE